MYYVCEENEWVPRFDYGYQISNNRFIFFAFDHLAKNKLVLFFFPLSSPIYSKDTQMPLYYIPFLYIFFLHHLHRL